MRIQRLVFGLLSLVFVLSSHVQAASFFPRYPIGQMTVDSLGHIVADAGVTITPTPPAGYSYTGVDWQFIGAAGDPQPTVSDLGSGHFNFHFAFTGYYPFAANVHYRNAAGSVSTEYVYLNTFALGGVVSLSSSWPTPHLAGNNFDMWYLTNFGYDFSGQPANTQTTGTDTVTIPSQPNNPLGIVGPAYSTQITWSEDNTMVKLDPATQGTSSADYRAIGGTGPSGWKPTVSIVFTDPDGVVHNIQDCSDTAPNAPDGITHFDALQRFYCASPTSLQITPESASQMKLQDIGINFDKHPTEYSYSDDYYFQLLDQNSKPMPNVWIQERFPQPASFRVMNQPFAWSAPIL